MGTMNRAFVIGCLAASMLSACTNGGLQTSTTDSTAGSGNSSQGTGGGTGSVPNPVESVDMRGYVDQGEYSGIKTVDLDKTTGDLLLTVPLGLDSSIVLGSGSINQLPGVTFSTVLGSDGRTYLQFRLPLKYVLRGVSTLPANRLPNGNPLPMMPAGEYPSLAFQLNTNNATIRNVYLYIGVDAIGVYVESKWLSCSNLPICINPTFPIKNQTGTKIVGYLTLIMGQGSNVGGFFASTVVPTDIARILDEYFIH